MTELFVMAVWAVHLLPRMAAHIAFRTQTFRIQPVMRKIRSGILPAMLVLIGVAPFTQAHSLPASRPAGAAAAEPVVIAATRDGISLDEAVSRAERQYRARVVRTDVQPRVHGAHRRAVRPVPLAHARPGRRRRSRLA
jgi:hypothetical protein